MADIIANAGVGTAKPTGAVQFGNRFFLTFEDRRPMYLQASHVDNQIKAYDCGIKAPTAAPTVANSVTAADNLTAGETVYIAYAFYSTRRQCFSQLSPIATHTVANPAKKLTINAFQAPRDNPISQDIDKILVCVQKGINPGLMGLMPENVVDASTFNFATASLTFDMTGLTLENGFNMSIAETYYALPPAVKYCEVFGERLWFAGQRRTVSLATTNLAVAKNQSFRGRTLAKLTVSGSERWNDSHLHMSVYAEDRYLGDVWDVHSATVAYLDRDVDANITGTASFFLSGYNDRIWPSSWHTFNTGNVAISYPECIDPSARQVLLPALDQGESLKGIRKLHEFLAVIFNETVLAMSGGLEVDIPQPVFRDLYGRVGTISDRSIARDQSGNLAWIGEEGFIVGDTAGVNSIAHELGIDRFFKGVPWVDLSSLKSAVMTYSRQHEGFVIANFTIGSVTGFWALLSLKPQYGLWLFDGQRVTSNLLEYQDSSGQGVILAGDAFTGRIKRLLSPETLLDVTVASDTAAAYSCYWREGWVSAQDGQPAIMAAVRILGAIIPTLSTFAATLTHYHEDYPLRQTGDHQNTAVSNALTSVNLLQDVDPGGGETRYHSTKLAFNSSAGAASARGLEIPRWQSLFAGET